MLVSRAVYIKGDFSGSVKEGKGKKQNYEKKYKQNENKERIPNGDYSLVKQNCGQVTMALLMKGKLESGESVESYLNRQGFKISVSPNINMSKMQYYFGNTAVNEYEYQAQKSLV